MEARNRCYGSLDIGLSPSGREQMDRLAEHLKDEPIAAIYSSPRSRSVESAEILCAGSSRPLIVEPGLAEIDFGDFEGLSYDEIALRHPEGYRTWMETPTKVQFPNGENFSEMRARVLRVFEFIVAQGGEKTLAIVSHGGVNRILVAWALQMPDTCLFRLAQQYAATNLLQFTAGVPSVELLNYRP